MKTGFPSRGRAIARPGLTGLLLRGFCLTVVMASALAASGGFALAAEDAELEALRQEVKRLKAQRRDYDRRLETLERRLQQREEAALSQRGKGLPSAPPETESAPAPAGMPAAEAEAGTAAAEGEKIVKEAPASKSAQAVYQEQHALFDRKFTLETGFTYSHFDRKQLVLSGFLALDAIFLGQISVDNVNADIFTFDILGRWGLTNRLQADLAVPIMYRRTVYQSSAAGSTPTIDEAKVTMDPDVQVGDVSAGIYYQLYPETVTRPDVVWNLRLKGPTGSHPYGVNLVTIGNLTVPEELPSGNGVWSLSTGLSFVKTVDPTILFANVGYFYNFDRHFDDISGSRGSQPGRVKLGDSLQYGLGIAFALNERTSMSFSYTHRFTAESKTKLDGGDWQSVTGSDANSATLNIGVTHALSDKTSLVTNLGVGMTPDAPDVQFTIKFPHAF